MNEIVNVISSMGFPIVACIYMYKYINTTVKELTNVINDNTKILIKLSEKLENEVSKHE
mgnify:CR=1 FL=1